MKYVRNCEPCRRRKQKCDRVHPCGPCRTRSAPDVCSFAGVQSVMNDQDYADVGQPRADEASTSSSTTAALNAVLPNAGTIKRLSDAYFREQKSGNASYVLTPDLFKESRTRASHDPASRALVHAVCGVGMLFGPDPDMAQVNAHLSTAEALVNKCDTVRHPNLLHVRIFFLLVVGLGPIRGPHLREHLQRAIFLAQTLHLHMEPNKYGPDEERLDRMSLFATLLKADWFSAMGTGRSFTMIHGDVFEYMPSLWDLHMGVEDKSCVKFDRKLRLSLRMADLCRRIVERDRTIYYLCEERSAEIQFDLSYLADENNIDLPFVVGPLPKRLLPRKAGDYLLEKVFCAMQWSLCKPFCYDGRLGALAYSGPGGGEDRCVASAVRNLQCVAGLFSDLVAASKAAAPDQPNNVATPPGMVVMWYHIFTSLRCALFLHRYVLTEEKLGHKNDKWERSNRETMRAALSDMRDVLQALAKHSVIARDGLRALADTSKGAPEVSTAPPAKRQRVTTDGTSQATPATPSASSILDGLQVFDDDDGRAFWDTIAWIEPQAGDW